MLYYTYLNASTAIFLLRLQILPQYAFIFLKHYNAHHALCYTIGIELLRDWCFPTL